jgi:predicted ester cyclase
VTPADVVTRYVERVWNAHDLDALAQLTTPGYLRHLGPGVAPLDRAAQRDRIAGVQAAFPDVAFAVEDIFHAGDRVSLRATVRGTHSGPFQGVEPTGRTVAFQAVDIFRVEGDLIAEHWGLLDIPALRAQLVGS